MTDFLLWFIDQGGQLTYATLEYQLPSEILRWDGHVELPFGSEPIFGVKIAVETLRAYEDLAAGTCFLHGVDV